MFSENSRNFQETAEPNSCHRFQFHKRSQRVVGVHNVALPVIAMRSAIHIIRPSRTSFRSSGQGTLLPLDPNIKKITHIIRNRKNKTFAIPAEATAIPPNPNAAAINATNRKITAQPNILFHLL